MGVMELEAKLRADGEREIQEIENKAKSELAALNDETNLLAGKEARRVLAEGEARARLEASRIVSEGKAKIMRNESAEKNLAVDRVFEDAKKKVLSMPDFGKTQLLLKLSSHPVFGNDGFNILVDGVYYPLLEGKVKGNLVKADLKDFGVILESSDGLVRVDMRLGVVLERLKPQLKPEVVKILFGGL